MNWPTIITAIILALVILGIVCHEICRRKKGAGCCGCSCKSCGGCGLKSLSDSKKI